MGKKPASTPKRGEQRLKTEKNKNPEARWLRDYFHDPPFGGCKLLFEKLLYSLCHTRMSDEQISTKLILRCDRRGELVNTPQGGHQRFPVNIMQSKSVGQKFQTVTKQIGRHRDQRTNQRIRRTDEKHPHVWSRHERVANRLHIAQERDHGKRQQGDGENSEIPLHKKPSPVHIVPGFVKQNRLQLPVGQFIKQLSTDNHDAPPNIKRAINHLI